VIPGTARLRRSARLLLRSAQDWASGDAARTVRASVERRLAGSSLPAQLVEVQPLRRAELWENKLHNLRLASVGLADVAIGPGDLFSFWALVGPPSAARGFLPGRTIVSGRLVSSVGGGLCQLSGIVYAIALRAGLDVRERHPHSLDLYDDATRFAPLGSDATVVYGHKDLRWVNTLPVTVCLRVDLDESEVRVSLCAPEPIPAQAVEHRVVERTSTSVLVETARVTPSGARATLCASRYRRKSSP
jgi:vancomycin resistance protein VanW